MSSISILLCSGSEFSVDVGVKLILALRLREVYSSLSEAGGLVRRRLLVGSTNLLVSGALNLTDFVGESLERFAAAWLCVAVCTGLVEIGCLTGGDLVGTGAIETIAGSDAMKAGIGEIRLAAAFLGL